MHKCFNSTHSIIAIFYNLNLLYIYKICTKHFFLFFILPLRLIISGSSLFSILPVRLISISTPGLFYNLLHKDFSFLQLYLVACLQIYTRSPLHTTLLLQYRSNYYYGRLLWSYKSFVYFFCLWPQYFYLSRNWKLFNLYN